MGMEQETLIYVEENDKKEAGILTNGLLNKDIKSRAYINALGAELGLKYLALENISTDKTYNLHNVHKLLEVFDISDIMLSNIHIDVRVVFNENQIFIPKSHFEYEIVPDIYLVFLLAEDSSHVKFLGFFEPKLINKNNQNADYYFIEKEKLTSPLNLKEFIENFKGNRTKALSEDVNSMAETLMVSVVDQNASKDEMKELLKYLSQSSMLRDRFIEFENFEILSYRAERSPDVTVPEEVAKNNIIDATIDDIKSSTETSDEVVESDQEDAAVSEIAADGLISDIASDVNSGEASLLENAASMSADLAADAMITENTDNPSAISEETQTVSDLSVISDDIKIDSEEINSDDVTDMFTNDSMFSAVEAIDDKVSAENNAEVSTVSDEQIHDSNEIMSNETVSSADSLTQDTVSHGFEVGNPDDFFEDMEFSESGEPTAVDNTNESEGIIFNDEEPSSVETVNFDTINQSPVQFEDDISAQDDMEILDISNVNAVPNDLDKNISETVEFNNIELSNEEPCYNELNGEETVPVLNMNDFTPLEPLPMEEVKAESYDMDSISLTDNMLPMPKINQDMPALEPIELADLNDMTVPPPQPKSEPAEESDDSDISAELDSIPDFGSMDMETADENLAENTDNNETIPSVVEEKTSPSAEEIQNLTEDDIVEQVADTGEEPVTDLEALTSKPETSEADSTQIPSIDNFSESDISDEADLSNSESEDNEDLITETSEAVETSNEDNSEENTPESTVSENDNLNTLFDENTDEDVEIEDFNSLNNELTQIPSIYQNNQKLPIKMVAVAAFLAVLVLGSFIGFSLKNKHSSADSESLAQEVPEENIPALPAAPDNTDILANTPEVQTLPAAQKEPVNIKKESKDVKVDTKNKTTAPVSAVSGVTKLSWEVPDYLSYSENIKKYLQTAGKSIKLSLSSDLLLVTEYAYSNQVKVDLKLSNDGSLKDSKIIKSSGSTQIDNVVLQTVKDTLNVIKPATGEVPTPDFRLALIINF